MIGDKVGLLWVGEAFYPTTEEYCQEAREQGISRRLAHLPQKFRLGLTYVFLAHRQAAGKDKAAIFGVFKPSRVEYVVKGDETEEQIAAIEKRGWTCVKVVNEAEEEAL